MLVAGCDHGGGAGAVDPTGRTIAITISGNGRSHEFTVERAVTEAEQARGLMFRASIPEDGGMLFWPYPAGGGPGRDANFWMKNTPSALDIVFIRADGTIARIAVQTIPFSEEPVRSDEPVTAVLELRGGRTAALGIAEGDRATWLGQAAQ